MLANPARSSGPMNDVRRGVLQEPGAGYTWRRNKDPPAAVQPFGVEPEVLHQLLHVVEDSKQQFRHVA
ncbi:hypothetical protein D3C81_2231500 [compost metagenome]